MQMQNPLPLHDSIHWPFALRLACLHRPLDRRHASNNYSLLGKRNNQAPIH